MLGGFKPERQPSRSGRQAKPFQPAIGQDFGTVAEAEAKTRGFVARFIAGCSGSAIAVTGIYGLVTGNYTAVLAVWAVAGPFIGAVVTYYFGPQKDDTR
jgi:hypothetical protein